ncbi:MAG: three-Cys-motif partner protein TcmP [Caulobacter sp.]|nr:three-Cys-motif partner protein TcmP [Caulobacter sp.]
MVADISRYAGREQAYIKHYFLENYLEKLIHKTAGRFDHIAYVDGFSGPWQNSDEDFDDTSFGIALQALRTAKGSWKTHGRDVRMSAYLVEKSSSAYAKLASVASRFPDISIVTYNDDFVDISAKLLADIPADAFAFLFIDPKGWRIRTGAIAPLLRRQNSEVVFNFMFDFVNRAASMADPEDGLNELITHGNWKRGLHEIDSQDPARPAKRKAILVDAFSETLRKVGGYDYVADTPILRPSIDRTLYSLIYATRKAKGIEVFRDCQIKTLHEQAAVRGVAKVARAETRSGQMEMFGSASEMASDGIEEFLATERTLAERALLACVPSSPASVRYEDAWPRILAKHAIRKTELNSIAGNLYRSGKLYCPDWVPKKRIPGENYRLCLPA